jgi:hypothetical protein
MPSLARRTIGARCARLAAGMFHGKVLTRVAMLLIASSALTANTARAQTSSQDQAERPSWGALDATGSGFLIGRTEFGEMTLSGYAVIRYINQLPATQTFVDLLGNVNVIDPRTDIQFHRSSYRSRENRFNQNSSPTADNYQVKLASYPVDTCNVRFNAQVIEVDRSPQSSLFGFYVGGQKGTTLSSASSIYF